jgi:Secretion system C-terminal sorting domain
MKKVILISLIVLVYPSVMNAQFAPAANQVGTTAIFKDSSIIINWATCVEDFQRGPQDITVATPLADYGDSTAAINIAEGNSADVVSLGDGGAIVLSFQYPIMNGVGADFAVFENSFSHDYLEFAHVEVSTDGINFVRFPSESVVQSSVQIAGFGSTVASEVYNLAGKYIQGYGTPFDLDDIVDSVGINLDSINFVKIIDVVGSIDSSFGSQDNLGNLINDPYPTPFGSGGFDLDGVGVINENNVLASLEAHEITFRFYPNPVINQLNIEFEGSQSIQILELSGKMIYEGWGENVIQLKLNEWKLSAGIYLLKVGNQVRKLVVK